MAGQVGLLGPLGRLLIARAGYDPDEEGMWRGGQYGDEYADLLYAMHYIGARKVEDYGDFRLQDIRSFDREVWGAYWDIQRKFGRLETQLAQAGPQFFVDSSGLRGLVSDVQETLIDQAVYCIRMIQVLQRLEEKGMVPRGSVDHRSK